MAQSVNQLPASFQRDGFLPPQQARQGNRKYRRLMIGLEGLANSGKTEFALSAPGPGLGVCLDRGMDLFDNITPPSTRRPNWALKTVDVPKAISMKQETALEYWREFKKTLYAAIDNPDARSVLLDGDSDSWELQRLAEFGKLLQVPSHLYSGVNAARRGLYARLYDSGKIIIATNKLKAEYKALGADPDKREATGRFVRQGFSDHDYLWSIQLRMMRDDTQGYGLKILMCKANSSLVGLELWNTDCNFESLVQVVYPQIPPSEWGL